MSLLAEHPKIKKAEIIINFFSICFNGQIYFKVNKSKKTKSFILKFVFSVYFLVNSKTCPPMLISNPDFSR